MHRVSLGNTVFEGENNAYLLAGSETTLIDAGVATAEAREQLRRGLRRRGTDFEEVDRIVLTHYHADHSGLVGEIQRASGATVHVHPDDAPLVEGDERAWEAYRARMEECFAEWGMPEAKRDELRSFMEASADQYGDPVEVDPIEEGDSLAAGDTRLDVVHTPGHTRGSCTFVLVDREEAFTGDALLPVYTPNVGGADVRVERPLQRYLDALARLADADLDRAWPGHRDPIDDPAARARVIVDHHRERARRVVDVLDSLGRADAWSVSAELFGELESIHVLHGPGEAHAHLEHLHRRGAVRKEGTEYRLAAETRERSDDGGTDAWSL